MKKNATVESLRESGRLALKRGRSAQAEQLFRQARSRATRGAALANNLAVALRRQGKTREAIEVLESAVKQEASSAPLYYNMGNAYRAAGLGEDAERAYRKAIEIEPSHSEAHNNLGLLYQEKREYNKAMARYAEAMKKNPDSFDAAYNYGSVCRRVGQIHEGIRGLRRAVRLCPHHFAAGFELFQLHYLSEDYEAAWQQYESRFLEGSEEESEEKRFSTSTRWHGEPMSSRETLRVTVEQGLGDLAQFARVVPTLRQQCDARIVLEVYEPLYRLFDQSFDVEVCLPTKGPAHDTHIPLGSVPNALGGPAPNEMTRPPYLHPNLEMVRRWRHLLSGTDNLRVGLNWAGNSDLKQQGGEPWRSLHLSDFMPLADLPGVELFALQKGKGREEIERYQKHMGLHDIGKYFEDFFDTAAAICALDLVVTNDTSVAHVAGGLGHPTWVLLPEDACWRWGLNKSKTDWYPTARLFRQENEDEGWNEMVQALRASLEGYSKMKLRKRPFNNLSRT